MEEKLPYATQKEAQYTIFHKSIFELTEVFSYGIILFSAPSTFVIYFYNIQWRHILIHDENFLYFKTFL